MSPNNVSAVGCSQEAPGIDGFHSRDLQSCGTQMTKAMMAMLVHITKAVHQNSFEGVHQHDRRDVT